jgi:Protein of unknown function (DUF2752)
MKTVSATDRGVRMTQVTSQPAPHPHGGPGALAVGGPVGPLHAGFWARRPAWAAPLAILACFGGGVAYTMIAHPTEISATASPTCLVKLTTGFDCPGCGGTRAFWYLLHGNIPAAARSHMVAVFAAPFLIYLYAAWAANLVFKRELPMLRFTPRTISMFLVVWAGFTILRNLPWAPFTWFFV